MITQAETDEIRTTIAEGRKTGRWTKPGDREWTLASGNEATHGEHPDDPTDQATVVWAPDGTTLYETDQEI